MSDEAFETADDPRIPPGKGFFKIGEVAKITGLKPYVLRYWEQEFTWLRPSKTSTRQRLYRRQDVALLLTIKRLRYDEHQTIASTREYIRDLRSRERPARHVREHREGYATPPRALMQDGLHSLSAADIARQLAELRRSVIELIEAVKE